MIGKLLQALLLPFASVVARTAGLSAAGDLLVMAELRRNTHADFVGLDCLKRQHGETLRSLFEAAATSGRWRAVHESHYDWWMFPISAPSRLGTKFSVYEWEVQQLLRDDAWVAAYLRGVELLARSWGWHLAEVRPLTSAEITDPSHQKWAHWPIRLSKCYNSLRQFGFHAQADSMKTFGKALLAAGESFDFRGNDLSGDFR